MAKPGHLFDAEYRSGSTPAGARVRVRFDTRGLAIEQEGAGTTYWPYASIAQAPSSGLVSRAPGAEAQLTLTSTAETHAMLTVVDQPDG